MMRLVLISVLLATSCGGRDDLRWTNTKEVPDGAAERLVEGLPPLFMPLGARMVADYLDYMLEHLWDGVTDGWGMRHSMRSSYDSVATEVRDASRDQQLLVLADLTYREGRSWVGHQVNDLAYRRVALMYPAIAAAPNEDVRWAAEGFRDVPQIDEAELNARADALEREFRSLQRRYRGFVPWREACWRHLDEQERELLATLQIARGDLRVSTGPLFHLLKSHGIPTRGANYYDEDFIGERTCREPAHFGPLPGRPGFTPR